jgi:hypothetical protein
VTAAAFTAASTVSITFFFTVIVIMIVTMTMTTTATTFMIMMMVMPMAAFSACNFAHRVNFNQICNFIKHSRIFTHLIFQMFILLGNGTKESRGIAQKLGSKLGMCWHDKILNFFLQLS